MKVVGLDLSLTDTGWAMYVLLDSWVPQNPSIATDRIRPKAKGMQRLEQIRDEVLLLCANADLVVIEGYSFGSKGAAVVNIGEMGGVVRLALYEDDLPVAEVPPSSLKKFATGAGNADKGLVLTQAVRRLDYQGSNHNEADALWLMFAGLVHLGISPVDFPKLQTDALDKVEWP